MEIFDTLGSPFPTSKYVSKKINLINPKKIKGEILNNHTCSQNHISKKIPSPKNKRKGTPC